MGLLNQVFRNLRGNLASLFKGKKKKREIPTDEPIEIPRSWSKPQPQPKSMPIVFKYKRRVPGLRWFKRMLAGMLLLINFSFSQFLLGSMGTVAQPMFILFLLNSFIIIDYLWKTRRAD